MSKISDKIGDEEDIFLRIVNELLGSLCDGVEYSLVLNEHRLSAFKSFLPEFEVQRLSELEILPTLLYNEYDLSVNLFFTKPLAK